MSQSSRGWQAGQKGRWSSSVHSLPAKLTDCGRRINAQEWCETPPSESWEENISHRAEILMTFCSKGRDVQRSIKTVEVFHGCGLLVCLLTLPKTLVLFFSPIYLEGKFCSHVLVLAGHMHFRARLQWQLALTLTPSKLLEFYGAKKRVFDLLRLCLKTHQSHPMLKYKQQKNIIYIFMCIFFSFPAQKAHSKQFKVLRVRTGYNVLYLYSNTWNCFECAFWAGKQRKIQQKVGNDTGYKQLQRGGNLNNDSNTVYSSRSSAYFGLVYFSAVHLLCNP